MKWIDDWYPVILDRTILPYVPQLAEPRNGEFCVAFDFKPSLVAEVCHHGYMPMGEIIANVPALLIKSHRQRCVLDFQHLHISRKLKRYARDLTFHIDLNFTGCLHRIAQHHQYSWLNPHLCDAFISLHHQPIAGVAFHSIEIYAGQELVAGEIGYTTGAIYSSLSGFHTKNGTGSVQLALLGLVLAESQFAFWDLGMEIPYKVALGAHVMDRKSFLQQWKTCRSCPTPRWATCLLEPQDMVEKLKWKPARVLNLS